MESDLKFKQNQLDVIDSWLRRTTEPFDDWEWDEEYLYIFLNNNLIEKYDRNDLMDFIEGFKSESTRSSY